MSHDTRIREGRGANPVNIDHLKRKHDNYNDFMFLIFGRPKFFRPPPLPPANFFSVTVKTNPNRENQS